MRTLVDGAEKGCIDGQQGDECRRARTLPYVTEAEEIRSPYMRPRLKPQNYPKNDLSVESGA